MAGSSATAQGWGFGIDGGLNISNIKIVNQEDDITGEFSPRVGLHISLFGEYGLTERWFVQLWLSYDQRGAKFKDDYITTNGQQYQSDLSLRTNYFNLPVLVKFNFLAKEKVDFYGQFGPTISFLTGAKAKGTETLDGSTSDIDEKLGDTWNLTTTNLIFGIGLEFNHTEFGSTFVQVQYNLGLTDIQQQGFYYDQGNTDPDARSRVITITIGAKGLLRSE
jgi:hypothetical protein